MQLKNVRNQLKIYRETLSEIQQFRREWKLAKELIYNNLCAIADELHINAIVEKDEKLEGLEYVKFSFGNRESGIAERAGKAKNVFDKQGGNLYFSQLYNGQISVWVSYPYIDGFTEWEVSSKPMDIYKPKALNETDITENLTRFFQLMTDWEHNNLVHHQNMLQRFSQRKEQQ